MPTNPRHRRDWPQLVGRDEPAVDQMDGNARRRARTRDALVTAAQAFLAEGIADPSIQAITDRAGVGFGSFFNHFATKQELFEAAGESAFRNIDAVLASYAAGIDDPLEQIVVFMRLFGRLPEIDRAAARAIAFMPTDTFAMYSGYDLQFERAFEVAKAEERLPRPDNDYVLNTFIWGAFKHLLVLRITGTDHPVSWVDDFTEIALTMMGVATDEAKRLAHAPLPEMD